MKIILRSEISTQVDPEDIDLDALSWTTGGGKVGGRAYARRRMPDGSIEYLHRRIAERVFGSIDGAKIDHLNGDTFDNRRQNLRAVTHTINVRNVGGAQKNSGTGVLGVNLRMYRGTPRYRAYICEGRKMISLGTFSTLEEAAAARLQGEAELWGVQPRRAVAHGVGE